MYESSSIVSGSYFSLRNLLPPGFYLIWLPLVLLEFWGAETKT